MNSVYVNVFMHVFFVFSSRSFLCPSSSSYLPSFYQFFFYCFTFLALDFFSFSCIPYFNSFSLFFFYFRSLPLFFSFSCSSIFALFFFFFFLNLYFVRPNLHLHTTKLSRVSKIRINRLLFRCGTPYVTEYNCE